MGGAFLCPTRRDRQIASFIEKGERGREREGEKREKREKREREREKEREREREREKRGTGRIRDIVIAITEILLAWGEGERKNRKTSVHS